MNKGKAGWKILVVLCVFAGAAFAYFHWSGEDAVSGREEMLSRLPGDPTAVIFVDAAQLRASPLLEQLFSWAPQVAPDADYTQFVQATGFHYEKDLERAAIAVMRQGNNKVTYVAIADGKFDRKKIEAYAASSGRKETVSGRAIFALNVGGRGKTSFFTFLSDDRIAWTDDPSYGAILLQRTAAVSPEEWREHFRRLAGSPMFVVLRQDSGSPSPLAEQAPRGFQSPQLAALLGQLQWISIAGKPDGNLLRVVVDGECLSEQTIKQLNDFLKGVVVLAQMGLSEAKTRKQLDPQLREGYLELLQSADIEKMDRGSSKSVRVVFDVTPKLLEAAREAGALAGTGKEPGKQGQGEKSR